MKKLSGALAAVMLAISMGFGAFALVGCGSSGSASGSAAASSAASESAASAASESATSASAASDAGTDEEQDADCYGDDLPAVKKSS